MTLESQLIRSISPFLERSANGGLAILLDKDMQGYIFSAVKSAEGAMQVVEKTLTSVYNQAVDNKDLVTSEIIGKTLLTFRTEIARISLQLGKQTEQ